MININRKRDAFAVWAGVTLAGSATCFGLVAATGNLTTTAAAAMPVDVQRVCSVPSADGLIFHTREYLCDAFTDAVQVAVVQDLSAQLSYDRCGEIDAWGDDDCALAGEYGDRFKGTHDDWAVDAA